MGAGNRSASRGAGTSDAEETTELADTKVLHDESAPEAGSGESSTSETEGWESGDVQPNPTESGNRARAAVCSRLLLWNDRPALRQTVEDSRDQLEGTPLGILLRAVDSTDPLDGIRDVVDRALAGEVSRRKTIVAQSDAEIAASAENLDATVEYLDAAIDAALTDMVWMRHCPLFDTFREEPAFLRRFERVRGRVEALEFS